MEWFRHLFRHPEGIPVEASEDVCETGQYAVDIDSYKIVTFGERQCYMGDILLVGRYSGKEFNRTTYILYDGHLYDAETGYMQGDSMKKYFMIAIKRLDNLALENTFRKHLEVFNMRKGKNGQANNN